MSVFMSKKKQIGLEEKKDICLMIQDSTQKEIGAKYNCSTTVIKRILRENNIKVDGKFRLNRNKKDVNISYFKEIDSVEKAYWLGYLAADGNINRILSKCTLVSKDLEIIEKFRSSVSSSHKISKIDRKDKRTGKSYPYYTIQITNKNFVYNLVRHGIAPYKSNNFVIPKIEDRLLSYFFAGLFDGDGYIGERNSGLPRISLISTKEILVFLQSYLISNFSISLTKIQKVTNKKDNVWKLFLYKDSITFLNWIYSDKNFNYLTRKHEKYLKFIR